MEDFSQFFQRITHHPTPHHWQQALADDDQPIDRMIHIPTGFGKTLGVLATWMWHRVIQQDDRWPRRLVWCLPMRVLVEQTEDEVRQILEQLQLYWNGIDDHSGKVGVHRLMGGADAGEWHLYPEVCAVLIGTQDMLLSRALNRGYASPRARWPMEFGLLNSDSLWVMDEVQLMDVGLATSAQLQAFRRDNRADKQNVRPAYTWWMSATLQPDWLKKSPDTRELARNLPHLSIAPPQRSGHLWDDVAKPFRIEVVENDNTLKVLARRVAQAHSDHNDSRGGPTLIVVNRVERAVKLYSALKKEMASDTTDIKLIHSRFRPSERSAWRKAFLNRKACTETTNRIIISTQVVEAGVDISATLLITDLAPWASLVQRLGRCARWGGIAEVIIMDTQPKDDRAAAPYSHAALEAARNALGVLEDLSPLHLEQFEDAYPERLPLLYPYEPKHLLLAHELDELFDTTPDLTGADIDISRFIRSGIERDLQLFWVDLPDRVAPEPTLQPSRDALCSVPFLQAQKWLFGEATKLKEGVLAWAWDWLNGEWRLAQKRDLYPGQTLLIDSRCGGYTEEIGWSMKVKGRVPVIQPVTANAADQADATQDDESLSTASQWKTIATHGRETGELAASLAATLIPEYASLFNLAGRWHDAGKAHPAFQGSMQGKDRPDNSLLAKAPQTAWLRGRNLYPMADGSRRPGFRHELVSVLALFSVLRRYDPDHPALLGPWRELLEAIDQTLKFNSPQQSPNSLEQEILQLDAEQFNLLAYLISAHHGKMRMAWHSSPADQEARCDKPRLRGLQEGDEIEEIVLTTSAGDTAPLTPLLIDLELAGAGLNPYTGPGWTERIIGLIEEHGVFQLAWLEALLRAADQRSSRLNSGDPLLDNEVDT
ncbi:MAG: CRISPR-associated helicase Cas3' [Sedimenticola sp.]